MVYTVGIRELRQQTSGVLKRVAAGESVEVTVHGHAVARIVPLRPWPLEQLVAERSSTDAEGDLLAVLDELTLPARPSGAVLPSRALEELRAEES